jgi:hypothetical protein
MEAAKPTAVAQGSWFLTVKTLSPSNDDIEK